MRATWTVAALLGLALSLAPAQAAFAQPEAETGEKKPEAAEKKPEGPKPFLASEVPGEAQKAQARLDELRVLADDQDSMTVVVEKLPKLQAEIDRLGPGRDIDLSSFASPALLQDQRAQWSRIARELESGREAAGERAADLRKGIEQLGKQKVVWEKTSEAAVTEGLPPAVLTRIGDTLASIIDVEKLLKSRRAEVLTLQNQIAESEEVARGEVTRLSVAEKQFQEELFQSKHVPLWKLVTKEQIESERSSELRSIWDEKPGVAALYLVERERAAVVFVLGFAVLFAGLTVLGRRAEPLAEENVAFRPTARLMRRPFSASLMVAMLVFPLMFDMLPRTVAAAFWGLLPVAFLRVMPVLIGKDMGPAIYGLTGWYVLAWTRIFLVSSAALDRWMMAFEGVAVVAFLGWLLRPARIEKLRRSDAPMSAIRTLIILSIPLVTLSVAANVIGNVTLAHLLDEGTLVAHCIAVLAFGSLQILSGMLAVGLRTDTARKLRMVRHHAPMLRRRGARLLGWVTFGFWAWLTLEAYRIREPVFAGVAGVLGARIEVGDIDISLGDIGLFFVFVWASFAISGAIRFVLDEDVLPRANLPRGVPFAISVLVRYSILLTGFMLAVAAAGLDLSRFALLVGALGVGIGIGLQDVVNNFVSGLILLFERPIQRGDTVEVGEVKGEIANIGLRASTLRTFEGAELVIPNSQFVSQAFVNWTLSDRQRRIHVPVGVAYGTDPETVLQILTDVAKSDERVLKDPEPQALMLSFGESSLDFELRAWTAQVENWMAIRSELTVEINRVLAEAGITIPFPQRDLHVKSVEAGLGEVSDGATSVLEKARVVRSVESDG